MRSYLIGIVVMVILVVADLEAFSDLCLLVAMVHMGLVPLLALGLVGWGLARRRQSALRQGGVLLLAAVASLFVSGLAMRAKLAASKQQGDAICKALSSYRAEMEDWPERLEQLVPDFLPVLPITHVGLIREVPYQYRRGQGGAGYELGFDSTFLIYCSRGPSGPWTCDD